MQTSEQKQEQEQEQQEQKRKVKGILKRPRAFEASMLGREMGWIDEKRVVFSEVAELREFWVDDAPTVSITAPFLIPKRS